MPIGTNAPRRYVHHMCNRYVQNGREVRPGQGSTVLMRGPGGKFEMLFNEAIFGGPARVESRSYWTSREGAEPVLIPDIERFGEKDQARSRQSWEDVPAHSAMEGLLLPRLPGKDYRLLKVVTQSATPEQFARLGNDRVPIFTQLGRRMLPPPENREAVTKPDLVPSDQLELPI